MPRSVDVAIIGAGSAGLYALGQVRRYTDDYVVLDGGDLGTTCARTGCMPSKAMLQVADELHRQHGPQGSGVRSESHIQGQSSGVLEHVRSLRDRFVDGVLSSSIDRMSAEHFIPSNARFVDTNLLETEDGTQVSATRVIIATGSRPVFPPQWHQYADRIFTTEELFDLDELPDSVAIVGLGSVGLEMGQALSRMGSDVVGIDAREVIGGIEDEVVNDLAVDLLGEDFPVWLGHGAEIRDVTEGSLFVRSGERRKHVDAVLASLGRKPNLEGLDLAAAGVALDSDGMPAVDPHSMRVADTDIYVIGDCNNQRPLLHEAAFEGRVAGFNAGAGAPRAFQRPTPLGIIFCDPNIVAVGKTLAQLNPDDIVIGEHRMDSDGRAVILGKNRGVIRIYVEKSSGRLLGGAMVAPGGEHLAHLLAWSIEMKLTVPQALSMPFYHPTLEESLQEALQDAYSRLELADDWPPHLRRRD